MTDASHRDATPHADRPTARFADQEVRFGHGGDSHQIADSATPSLTTQQGMPVSDDQNSLKVGDRGPTSLEDQHLNLVESPALSILRNGPDSFAGRKVGVLVTDGADAALLAALQQALDDEGAMHEVVAPEVGGVTDSDDNDVSAQQKIDGGPSVLYDAVVLLPSKEGAETLADDATARDFVTDAFAHAKFIGYVDAAMPLLEKAGIAADLDEGCIALNGSGSASTFVEQCRALRHWPREQAVDQT